MTTNLQSAPYFDDYSEDKKFHKVLFKAGIPVQTRELNQIQSILQKQIERFGSGVYKEGAMVIPGQVSVDTNIFYLKLDSTYSYNITLDNLFPIAVGKVLTSVATGLSLKVIAVSYPSSKYPEYTLMVKVVNSGTDGVTKTAKENDIYKVFNEDKTDTTYQVCTAQTDAMGKGTIASIGRGVYFTHGNFVLVQQQTVVLEPYSTTPTCDVGLEYVESIVTAKTDESLLDNAQGSFNYTAPGADRFSVDLVLSKKDYQSPSQTTFIPLLSINAGVIENIVDKTALGAIGDIMARRTYDESGDYVVKNFALQVKQFRDNSRGEWVANKKYIQGDVVYVTQGSTKTYFTCVSKSGVSGSITPIHYKDDYVSDGVIKWRYTIAPEFNFGLKNPDSFADPAFNEENFILGVDPGKAYVRGYEVENVGTKWLTQHKPRTTAQSEVLNLDFNVGNYIIVDNLHGWNQNLINIEEFTTVNIYNKEIIKVISSVGLTANLNSATVTFSSAPAYAIGTSLFNENKDYIGKIASISGTTATLTDKAVNSSVAEDGVHYYAVNGAVPSGATYIGTARIRSIEYHGGGSNVSDAKAQFKISIFDVKMMPGRNFSLEARSLALISGSSATSFTANLVADTVTKLPGTISVLSPVGNVKTQVSSGYTVVLAGTIPNLAAGMTITGQNIPDGAKVVSVSAATDTTIAISKPLTATVPAGTYIQFHTNIVNGTNTFFLTGVPAVGDATTPIKPGMMLYVGGEYISVATVDTETRLTLSKPVAYPISGQQLTIVSNTIYEPERSSLVYRLPFDYVSGLRDSNGNNITYYSAVEQYKGLVGADGVFTIGPAETGNNHKFAPYTTVNYTFTDNSSGATIVPTTATLSTDSTTITVKFSPEFAALCVSSPRDVSMICTVNIQDGIASSEKVKTLRIGVVNKFDQATASQKNIKLLGYADGFRLIGVYMAEGSAFSTTDPGLAATAYTADITDRYTFDDGQRDTHYDLCSITLKAGYPAPTAPIRVLFEYFQHTGHGSYFSANSYLSTIEYDDIPSYKGVRLSDCVDFRPRIAQGGVTFLPQYGASTTALPKRGVSFVTTMGYYLGRVDKISVNKTGQFILTEGVPSVDPKEPSTPAEAMLLYKLTLPPYAQYPNDVKVTPIDNKRYTMRDIGKLDARISTLEYYTTLNMLEQQTKSMSITDSHGLDRFKNGFIVDAFSGHGVGNVSANDYRCSVDMINQELRPFTAQESITLAEGIPTEVNRKDFNYTVNNGILTLPFSNVSFIKQHYASRTENVNPFAVFSFIGSVNLTPQSDNWFETKTAPALLLNVEGNYNTVLAKSQKEGVLGTVWNAWQTVWTGVPIETGKTSSTKSYTKEGDGGSKVTTNTTTTLTTYATQKGEQRNGVTTSITTKIDTQNLGDKVISTSVIPYIRSRWVTFSAHGLKPGTKMYPFFDDANMSAYTIPATVVTITPSKGTFDYKSDAGVDTLSARYIGTGKSFNLNVGDVVYTSKRGATVYGDNSSVAAAVCVYVNRESSTSVKLHLVNISGSDSNGFAVGDIVTGSISEAVGTITAVQAVATKPSQVPTTSPASLVTDSSGNMCGMFLIPNSENLKFRTGERQFLLVDDLVASDATTEASSNYISSGSLATHQTTILSIRNAVLTSTAVSDNRTTASISQVQSSSTNVVTTPSHIVAEKLPAQPISNPAPAAVSDAQSIKVGASTTSSNISGSISPDNSSKTESSRSEHNNKKSLFRRRTCWEDPLAQTFLVNSAGGAFVTKLDVFFASKDASLPVHVEIRECQTGIPSSQVVPGSRVSLMPDEVNISSDSKTATTFNFPYPIYLSDGVEYALVLMSDSNSYTVWISNLGETDVSTNSVIGKQPYNGVLFKSQNASTWTADQLQDLKFTLYKAKFNSGVYGECLLVNDEVPPMLLEANPIQTKSGSHLVRVYAPNHGMWGAVDPTSGSQVKVSGVLGDALVITNISIASTTVTVTVKSTSMLTTGLSVSITGFSGTAAGYNGTYAITVASGTTFTYVVPSATNTTAPAPFVAGGYIAYSSKLNGIPVSVINGQHFIYAADLDWYVFDVGTTYVATGSGFGGGSNVYSTYDVKYEVLQPHIERVKFSDTILDFLARPMTSRSISGYEGAYQLKDWARVQNENNNYFNQVMCVANPLNKKATQPYTFAMIARMFTNNENLSPVVDLRRSSAILVSNKVNSPTFVYTGGTASDSNYYIDSLEDNVNIFGHFTGGTTTINETSVTLPNTPGYNSGKITFEKADSNMYTDDAATQDAFSGVLPGDYIKVISFAHSGATTITTNGTVNVTFSAAVTLNAGTEIWTSINTATSANYAPGNGTSVYVGKLLNKVNNATTGTLIASAPALAATSFSYSDPTLHNSGIYLVRFVSPNRNEIGLSGKNPVIDMPTAATTKVVVKNLGGFADDIAPDNTTSYSKYVTKRVNLANNSTALTIMLGAAVQTGAELKVYYKVNPVGNSSDFDLLGYVQATPVTPIPTSDSGEFVDVTYTLNNVTPFDAFQVKIVMNSINSAKIARVKDLRIIACA